MKALYGCRIAPREWYKVLELFVISRRFKHSVLDPCLFVSGTGDSFAMIFYVVDNPVGEAPTERASEALMSFHDEVSVVNPVGEAPTKRVSEALMPFPDEVSDYQLGEVPMQEAVEVMAGDPDALPFEVVEEMESVSFVRLIRDGMDKQCILLTGGEASPAPSNRKEMLTLSPEEREAFLAAEKRELAAIEERQVIEDEVPIPPGVRPVGSRYVYTWKDPVAQDNTEIHKERLAKARLTMKDFKKGGDNLRETFAPTGRGVTFRLLMLIATICMLMCDHIDVNTAFLYADLMKPMYMEGPPGFPCQPGFCLKVIKALYECRTAPREWYKTLRIFILTLGFTQTLLDPCLFFKWVEENLCLILIYVDDILIFANSRRQLDAIKAAFFTSFKCKDLGSVKRFLGVWIEQARDFSILMLHQTPYCQEITSKPSQLVAAQERKRGADFPEEEDSRAEA